MGLFRSYAAPWAVRLALFALFLRALAPVGQAAASGGEHGGSMQAFALCSSFAAQQAPDETNGPAKHGAAHHCVMCMANPVAAAAVLATVAADVLAPRLSMGPVEPSAQDATALKFAPKADPARAPPAL